MTYNQFEIIILGSGASTGVPVIGCNCNVCISSDSKNHRLRSSLYIKDLINKQNFLIDTSPDLRQQLLTHKLKKVDHVLYTHMHADHTHGFDELRTLNFINKQPIDCWLSEEHEQEMKVRFSYAFEQDQVKGTYKPQVKLHTITHNPFKVGNRVIEFVTLPHGNTSSLAFKLDNFLYATDFKNFPQDLVKEWSKQVDYMVASGVMLKEHPTHSTIDETITLMQSLDVKAGFITHLSHHVEYHKESKKLPQNIHFAYDGLSIKV